MNVARTKCKLSPPRQRLLHLLQRIYFGRVDGLRVADGEPQFDPPPKVTREIKFGGANAPRAELPEDFALKRQHLELFERLDRIGNGVIESLSVQHGLPFRMLLAEPA
jgi:hypothetical protein